MGCCGRGSSTTIPGPAYPKEIELSDGTKVMVSSAAMERTERARDTQRQRDRAKSLGYTAERR